MDIALDWPIYHHLFRIGEDAWITRSANKGYKHIIAGLDRDLSIPVRHRRADGRAPVAAEGAIKPDSFHGVVEELFVGFGAVNLGEAVDFAQMLGANAEIIVHDLRELYRMLKIGLEAMVHDLPLETDWAPLRWLLA